MAIEYKKNQAKFIDVVSIDETEALVEWLQSKNNIKIDLASCSHLHSAILQVLIAVQVRIAVWPRDANLRAWLESVLKSN
jgi:hypothetical protein